VAQADDLEKNAFFIEAAALHLEQARSLMPDVTEFDLGWVDRNIRDSAMALRDLANDLRVEADSGAS
jgi:hypothetical protein